MGLLGPIACTRLISVTRFGLIGRLQYSFGHNILCMFLTVHWKPQILQMGNHYSCCDLWKYKLIHPDLLCGMVHIQSFTENAFLVPFDGMDQVINCYFSYCLCWCARFPMCVSKANHSEFSTAWAEHAYADIHQGLNFQPEKCGGSCFFDQTS